MMSLFAKQPNTMTIDPSALTDVERQFQEMFESMVIGQPEATRMALSINNAYLNPLRDKSRPIGVYLLVGPSRTGKSHTARIIAKIYHGDEEALTRIQASAYQDKHEMQDLKGAPPSYAGYKDPQDKNKALEPTDTDTYSRLSPHNIRRVRAGSTETIDIVVIEEFEKGCQDFWKLWMDIFDNGQLILRNGEIADLRNAVIILTSNLGTREIADMEKPGLGFLNNARELTPGEIKKSTEAVFLKTYPPEFRNRIDALVSFRHLQAEDRSAILDAEIKQLQSLVYEKLPPEGLFELRVEPSAREHLLVAAGSNIAELKRSVQSQIADALGRLLAGNRIKGKDLVCFSLDGEKLVINVTADAASLPEQDLYDVKNRRADSKQQEKPVQHQPASATSSCTALQPWTPQQWKATIWGNNKKDAQEKSYPVIDDLENEFGVVVPKVVLSRIAPWKVDLIVTASDNQIKQIKKKYNWLVFVPTSMQ